ncbi:MAG TPA: hypothetical protein VMN39_10030 [Longimicrobiaceae bacterium]|nr:hypothetical protein [Longimicrobiaceae bacterium]
MRTHQSAIRRGLLLACALGLLSACGDDSVTEPDDDDQEPAAALVSMPGFVFSPFTTTIRVGQSVSFDFPSEPHNVIFERKTGAPTDIQATSNRRIARTFAVAGSFPYDCTLHPGMAGVVIVQ